MSHHKKASFSKGAFFKRRATEDFFKKNFSRIPSKKESSIGLLETAYKAYDA
jgi:hypothetical protein